MAKIFQQKIDISAAGTLKGVSASATVGNFTVDTTGTTADDTLAAFGTLSNIVGVTIKGYVIPERKTADGILIRGVSALWYEIVNELKDDWNKAYRLGDREWEELIGGAFKKQGYEVTVTPRRGDFGRDVIAVKHGIGSVKLLNSMKAYNPKLLVTAAEVRELVGVISMDHAASKGVFTTTSGFAPELKKDPRLAAMVPTRLELIDGPALQEWLRELAEK